MPNHSTSCLPSTQPAADCWQFWIDVGGTFTDCIGVLATGEITQFKTLSSGVTRGKVETTGGNSIVDRLRTADPSSFWKSAICRLLDRFGNLVVTAYVQDFDADKGRLLLDVSIPNDVASYELDVGLSAPVLAIRWLLQLSPDDVCPPVRVRFGTTRGTNALLTRTGAKTALITTKGFADVPLIGNQDRPELFSLNIVKPQPLFSRVFEVDERIAADGTVLRDLTSDDELERQLGKQILRDEFDSVAICLMNAYQNDSHEKRLETILRQLGFDEVSRSSEVSPLIRFVPRCDTTVLDAYLNPILREYLDEIRSTLPGSDVQVMTSTGGLVDSHRFRGRDCILSGPAGGIVGFSKVARAEGFDHAIGFDMGGTSTDVARFAGQFEFENETTKADVRILTPVLAIETVAAGGGSICGFDGTRLFVGPQSAGADPGPACYGAGGPLTVTDLNVFLGRVLPQHFPFQLHVQAIDIRLQQLREAMVLAGALDQDSSLESLAEGLLQIANDNMVQAIRRVSVAKGYLPSEHVLVSFGGAGGQHACAIARSLGIQTVLIHPFAGILSAYGMGQADVREIRQASVLQLLSDVSLKHVANVRQRLEVETSRGVLAQGVSEEFLLPSKLSLELRYLGTDSALMIVEQHDKSFREVFEDEHRRLFGYVRPDREIEIASMKVETVGVATASEVEFGAVTDQQSFEGPRNESSVWFNGRRYAASVVTRNQLRPHDVVQGPAIICEPTSTVLVEPGCSASITSTGTILMSIDQQSAHKISAGNGKQAVDSVLLEVFNNQFVSIAQQMGETLRRTSTSTNVRERLDFSCALFDSSGRLVVNAPHVPVHLGAMGETVQAIMQEFTDMRPGDVFVTNDPYRGGSHLPDVTVVTPVFVDAPPSDSPAFYVANRAHHAEIGGVVPGSMPPFSSSLAEEGVLIRGQRLVEQGQLLDDELRRLLTSGPFPSRCVDDNLADLAAQVAANECGVRLLKELTDQKSTAIVQAYMTHIQNASAKKMRLCLSQLPDSTVAFEDQLDDGTPVRVKITVSGQQATVDFTGTGGVHAGNLNANRAITTSAVLYSFRCLLDQDVPLNAGVLEPVEIIIPEGLINPPAGPSPETSPAMVGGNVETSQRIVDVLLGALGLAAASQGTMNNLTFGDATFGYYETICGGAGATSTVNGADAVHTNMTNTRLTDPEVLEQRYPVCLQEFSIRAGSGGRGRFQGGNGIVREIEFLRPLRVSMLSQRRGANAPYGLEGGEGGLPGQNLIMDHATSTDIGGCFSGEVAAGSSLKIMTPGGGGFGPPGRQSVE